MIRQLSMPHKGLVAGLGLVLLISPGVAAAQDRSSQERLDRIERDLNMLQRQVYRGAPPPTGGDPGAAMGTELRLNRIEEQMRDLTGRVEEATNQVERLRQRLDQVNSDIDARINQGPQAGQIASVAPSSRSGGAGPRPLTDATTAGLAPPGPPPSSGVPRGSAAPSPSFGTLTPPGSPHGAAPPGFPSPPPGLEPASTGPDGGPAGPGRLLPSGSATDQYNYAFGLLKQADYPGAETALRAFVERHPTDPMAGNAQYWLGETYFARSKFMEAAGAFADGYKRFPKSPKAPDTLLKLGMALGQANQKQNACVALGQLDQAFPHAASNLKQQAATEKRRLGC